MDREAELALVGRIRDGDAAAFDIVYEEYRSRLFSFLARLSRSRDVAEDLAEETWLRLVASSGRLQPDTRLGPWPFASWLSAACRRLEPALVGCLCALFLVEVLSRAVRLYRF